MPFFDASSLQDAFINSNEVIIPTSESKSKSTDALAAAAISPLEGGLGGLQMASLNHSSPVVRYAKAGLLLRKDDRVEGGKKASSRKWREWSVVLTASQLLFFKDPTIVEELATSGSIDSRGRRTTRLPPGRTFKPDSVLPLKGFVAVYDFSFVKRSNTFALVAESKQQLLFQAPDDSELNEWLGLINWAASFQNTGVKLRTQPTVEASGTRRPHASKGSTKSQSSDEAASQHRRMIFSAQGQVVGSAPGGDCAWDDDQ